LGRVTDLAQAIDTLAAKTTFSGVVRIDRSGGVEFEKAYGYADRRHEIANTVETQFAIASGTKGLTALAVMRLIEGGSLDFHTTARSVLGADLPRVRNEVTIEHLLSHRSGIGDYFDESAGHEITDYVLPVSVHQLAETEDYLAVLDGYETAFSPDERFAYCNGGFVVLALIAERVGGEPFRELVRRRVCEPAAMVHTAFLRSDELPGNAAVGYLREDGPRTNVFHLPVRGSGDGGIYSTAADVRALWVSLFAGRIVPSHRVEQMVRPRSEVPSEERRYGLGFWLHASSDVVMLEGYDAGVSFWTAHDPTSAATCTVISNTSEGAWGIAELLARHVSS
jgi:CubicO group peptidase (beta-lactamase class C family)